MKLTDAIQTLNECIPRPSNKMVDSDHFNITVAWQTIKPFLEDFTPCEDVKDQLKAMTRGRSEQIEVIRNRIDSRGLTDEEKSLLDDLMLPREYDKRKGRKR